jgi:hypothetical protein
MSSNASPLSTHLHALAVCLQVKQGALQLASQAGLNVTQLKALTHLSTLHQQQQQSHGAAAAGGTVAALSHQAMVVASLQGV